MKIKRKAHADDVRVPVWSYSLWYIVLQRWRCLHQAAEKDVARLGDTDPKVCDRGLQKTVQLVRDLIQLNDIYNVCPNSSRSRHTLPHHLHRPFSQHPRIGWKPARHVVVRLVLDDERRARVPTRTVLKLCRIIQAILDEALHALGAVAVRLVVVAEEEAREPENGLLHEGRQRRRAAVVDDALAGLGGRGREGEDLHAVADGRDGAFGRVRDVAGRGARGVGEVGGEQVVHGRRVDDLPYAFVVPAGQEDHVVFRHGELWRRPGVRLADASGDVRVGRDHGVVGFLGFVLAVSGLRRCEAGGGKSTFLVCAEKGTGEAVEHFRVTAWGLALLGSKVNVEASFGEDLVGYCGLCGEDSEAITEYSR